MHARLEDRERGERWEGKDVEFFVQNAIGRLKRKAQVLGHTCCDKAARKIREGAVQAGAGLTKLPPQVTIILSIIAVAFGLHLLADDGEEVGPSCHFVKC